jgi:WD40 repeat protein/tetratricopeptide (TPR) repeat protein
MNVRIFFSSPGDVTMERETAKRIVDRLQSEIGEAAKLQPYFWEHEVMVATKDYQENIPHMDDFDMVVCILWSRLGTPLDPARHPKPGGGGFKSGTEYEFFTAMQAHELRGTPDIFVFRNTTEPRRPSRPKEVREKMDREIDRLDDFFDTYFQDEQFFTRAINIYSTLGEFEDKLTIALRSYLTGRLPAVAAEGERKYRPKYHRQPYLGLSAFDYEDAPVFFGRTAEVGEIITAYQTQEMEASGAADAPPKHFVLILGSSGSGKSSLARAGVLPMLTNPGVIEGANAWRTAIFKPADVPGDPVLALVQSLATDHGLPELFADGTKPQEIADLIRSQPQGGGLLLRQALTQAGAQALTKQKHELGKRLELLTAENRPEDADLLREKIANLTVPAVRIALLADQLEELFTSDLSPDSLATFVSILVALANSGRVFVLATLRSDFYPRCLEHPELVGLMQGSGTYALPAPTATDIGQMIRQPAAIAGLTFEENTSTGEKLDELLRDAALKDTAALPLLSYTLEQLYEQRTERGLLTLKAYEELGGLEGAIGSRAETVFSSLPGEAQAAFDGLCKQLVTLQEGGEPTRRRAFYTTLTRTPESKALLDALVNARLLTADQSPSGERIISVAHEALLRHWPRLVSWVEDNRLFLNTRTRVASRLADWVEKGKTDEYLIPRGPNLSAAESILSGHLASLDPLEIEFIGKSADRIRKEDQRRLRNARLITAGAVVLCVIAVAGGLLAGVAKRQAQRERAAAIKQEKIAIKATENSVRSETRIAYTKGIRLLESGKEREGLTALAQTLALEPNHSGALERIYSEQLYAKPRPFPIFSSTGGEGMRQRIGGGLQGSSQYAVHLSERDKPAVYDVTTGKIISGAWENEPDSLTPLISYDSNYVLNIRSDMSLHIWDTRSGEKGAVSRIDPKFGQAWVTVDGRFFVMSLPTGEVKIGNTWTGEETGSWRMKSEVVSLCGSGSEYFMSCSMSELVIHDVAAKKELPPLTPPEGYDFLDVVPAFSNVSGWDSHRAVVRMAKKNTFPAQHRLRFLDVAEGKFDETSKSPDHPFILGYMPNADGTAVAVSPYQANAVLQYADVEKKDVTYEDSKSSPIISLSPDGQLLATASVDGRVDIFEAKSGNRLFSPANHESAINEMSFTADGRHLLTATNLTATVWELAAASALTMRADFTGSFERSFLDGNVLRVKAGNQVSRIDIATMQAHDSGTTMPENDFGNSYADLTIQYACVYESKGVVSFYDISGDKAVKKGTWTSPVKDVTNWELSPDGTLFAAMGGKHVHLVRTSDATTLADFEIPETELISLLFTSDNRYLAGLFPPPAGSGGMPTMRLWNAEQRKPVDLDLPAAYYATYTISPDGKWLAVASNGEKFNRASSFALIDLENPEKGHRKFPHPAQISGMTFADDTSLLGVYGIGGTLRVWDLETMDFRDAPLSAGADQIDSFRFSPDFNRIATVSTMNGKSAVRVWDWMEAAPVSIPWNFPAAVRAIHFSEDGSQIIVISEAADGTFKHFVSIREIIPPKEIAGALLPLVQSAVAMRVEAAGVPVPTAAGKFSSMMPADGKDFWFREKPFARKVSPGINIPTSRWISYPDLTTGEVALAMPRVPLARAKMADWWQLALDSEKPPADETPEQMQARSERDISFRESISDSVDFAKRNTLGDADTSYLLARRMRADGETEYAVSLLETALEADPTHEDALQLSAKIAIDRSHHEEAVGFLRKLKDAHPGNSNYRAEFGLSLLESGKTKEALEELKEVADKPGLEDRARALSLTALERHKEALPFYRKLAEADGTNEITRLIYLASGNYYAGENEAAIELYAKLIRMEPGASDPDIINSVAINGLIIKALLETLKLTLEKHPELAPKDAE